MRTSLWRWFGMLALLAPLVGHAAQKRTVCVFDIVGASGDQFNIMQDYKTAALQHGYDLNLKVYTDERIAAEDLSAGQCDASAITGVRARRFNSYSGSIDSIGAIPNYKAMHIAMEVLGSNKKSVNKRLKGKTYEVMGVMPMGAAYLFVKSKKMNNVDALAGKSIAVLSYDKAEARMAAKVGMSPVPSDITNFAGRFNNNSVDVAFAPLEAYQALELYRGMRPNGGIVDYVLGQLSYQLIEHNGAFSEKFADWSRQWFATQGWTRAMRVVHNAHKQVPKKWWINVSAQNTARYNQMMRESRISMTKDGIYDKSMMSLLRKIRCKVDASRAECSDKKELYNQ